MEDKKERKRVRQFHLKIIARPKMSTHANAQNQNKKQYREREREKKREIYKKKERKR